jgi:beta-lactamase superfamily II metal-dependent hydrolase
MTKNLALAWVLLYATFPCWASAADGRLDIYWIDVEGGASTLLVTPADESILIDSGNPGRRDPNRIVHVATQVAKLRKIDHLITTHYHRDHVGGASLLATLMPVGVVYDNGRFAEMPNDPGEEYFSLACDRRQVINPGDELDLKQLAGAPEISLRCLGTRQTFVPAAPSSQANEAICATCQPKDRDGSDNANSVVSIVQFGSFRFFDGGDLTWNQEMKLVCPHDLIGPVDVYQVTHHGLDSSNNPVVLQTIQPRVAVMNNGDTKGCLPDVYANLVSTPSIERIFQMHKNLRPDGALNNVEDQYIANRESTDQCEGHYIHLSVSPDSLQYSVSIPANEITETFETRKK